MSAIALRSDINGLRGVAVLSVVGFHAFPEVFSSGFLGVDVFFVISGFLITSIILAQLASGRFSFVAFYSNRVKRIFPALIVVLVFCFVVGIFLLSIDEFRELSREALGGTLFVANFIFAADVGYFDASADAKPLLHLWSLGVEEQFYLVWPVAVVALSRAHKSVFLWTSLVGAISFALHLQASISDQSMAFYLPHTRIWQLLVGAVLADLSMQRASSQQTTMIGGASASSQRNIASAVGLFLVLAAVFLMPPELLPPGARAIAPTLGAALIIAGGAHSWVNRKVLGGDALVQVGLISYCLYLWHWPLLYFLRLAWGADVPLGYRIAVVMASVFLAGATYTLVENPIRAPGKTRCKVLALLAAMTSLVCTSLLGYATDSIPLHLVNRSSARLEGDIDHVAFFQYMDKHSYACTPLAIYESAIEYDGHRRCRQSRNDAAPSMALLGDSHAEHVFIGLAQALPAVNIVYYTNIGAPYVGRSDHKMALEHTIAAKNITTVIVAAYWENQADLPQLKELLTALSEAGKKVYLLDDVPGFSFQPNECKFSRWIRSSWRCSESKARFSIQSATYIPILEAAADNVSGVNLLKVGAGFCDEQDCNMTRGNQILYRDPHHLNVPGSRFLGQLILDRAPDIRHLQPSPVPESESTP